MLALPRAAKMEVVMLLTSIADLFFELLRMKIDFLNYKVSGAIFSS